MRIAHVILSRGFAGTERATAEMCNAHGTTHPVMLILKRSHTRDGVSIRQYLDPRVHVVEVSPLRPRRGITRALQEFDPDVVHAHLRRSTRLLARIRPAAAAVATLHLTVNGPHFAAMDGLICIAQWQRRDIPPDYRGLVFHINESIVPCRRLAPDEIAALRRELGAGADDYLIGGVGRLAHSKGFDLLIEAFKRATLPRSRLVILGEGRERRQLQRLCDQRIALPGFRARIKEYYQAFDLFVSPSRSEPLGRVVLEALDAGVPVVASRCDGPSEILSAYPGDLVPVGDVDALAAQLTKHFQARTPHARHDLSAYHIDAVAPQTLAAYAQLIQRRQAASNSGAISA
jgi:glycosyltransferase involved in cell wall biosynthesis